MTTLRTPPGRRPRLSLGRKAGGFFLLLAACLAVVGLVSLAQLHAVGLDARRFVEESREARLAQQMNAAIEQLQLLVRIEAAGEVPSFTLARLALARARLDELQGAHRDDPSRPAHQSEEQAGFHEIDRGLDRLEESARAGHGLDADVLWQVQEAATRVAEETEEEVGVASADLGDRVERLVGVLVVTMAGVVLVLIGLYVLTRRHVVTPLLTLRRGAHAFGSGDLGHRIELSSRDEIGDLADEFNRMADSLTETQRDLERRVRERTAELLRASKLADFGTFAAGIAHEVNTPLASIASCAEGLERRVRAGTATPAEQVEYLQTIAHEAYRAHDITARLLQLSRSDAGDPQPIDLAAAVGNVARLLEHDMQRRGIVFARRMPERPIVLQANGAEIEQLLINLLKNAADASPRGGTILLRCGEAGEWISIEVDDEGPGVEPSRRDAIFQPFFSTKRPGEGTGLGLSLVARIVESHGGRIEVGDSPSGGARFRVLLPRFPALEAA